MPFGLSCGANRIDITYIIPEWCECECHVERLNNVLLIVILMLNSANHCSVAFRRFCHLGILGLSNSLLYHVCIKKLK